MTTQLKELKRIRSDSLAALCRHFEWSEKVASFITPHASVATVLASLINHRYWFDAATLLAHALPKREAVSWAVLVTRDYFTVASPETRAAEQAVIEAVQKWILQPEDELRMAAHAAGVKVGNRLPSYWAAMGAFWSTGNITPEVGVITPPPPFLYARAVAASIDMAASLSGSGRDQNYEKWLKIGLSIAEGRG